MAFVKLLVIGNVDVFVLVAKPCGVRKSYIKEIDSEYIFESTPAEYIQRLSNILDGRYLNSHIPHEAGYPVICSISTMMRILQNMGYDVTPDENYDVMLEQAAIPLTNAQKRARLADIRKEREQKIVY
ncbi:hypothetical protein J3L11_09930 [Shewanella sp. 4t3-1-2LB]|uniref:hypothetical protein n=1 Tax=Shewanella sp. 4t3-1-2LB TaxID=2817682 RepID=UPI001A996538|nr:hypothetical protein [Shewanella sp. 4t3-1-2LB]MBO1271958.1 hypothetical protein [Shewanella sp. 4t3-1-2LB]